MILAALPLAAQAAAINTSRSNIKRPSIVASPSPTHGASPESANGKAGCAPTTADTAGPCAPASADAPGMAPTGTTSEFKNRKHNYKGTVTLVR
jgi:hypothetical protein